MLPLFRVISSSLKAVYDDREARAVSMMVLEDIYPEASQSELMLMDESRWDDGSEKSKKLQEIVLRLKKGEPVQYVLGKADFCDSTFFVAPGVLIPRPETEQLVHEVVDFLHSHSEKDTILDIGTGSGCIALSIKNLVPDASVEGWDISEKALKIARNNSELLSLQVKFLQKDVFSQVVSSPQYDVIVSNPPYIAEEEKKYMSKNVLDFEPFEALFVPDDNPLLFYDRIVQIATLMLRKGGMLAFEINQRFGEDVSLLMRDKGFEDVVLKKDIFDNFRFVTGIWK